MQRHLKNTHLSVGQNFLHYRIEEVVGEGAMGIVYKAFDKKRQQHIALKILQADFIGEKQHRKFVLEVKAIAKLYHQNIVKLFDAGVEPLHYFAMEYVEGKTLAQVVNSEDLDFSTLGKIFHKISLALYHAHVKGIIHGDIKPQNIMIDENYEPKIMDFGLAKNRKGTTNNSTSVEGTPAYLAPEQLQYKAVDKRSDIYSLGVTLYYCLTKQLPFSEKNYAALFYQIVHHEPQKPREIIKHIPKSLERICLKCIQRSPESRYVNSKFLACDFKQFVDGKSLAQELSQKMWKNTFLFYGEVLLLLTTTIFIVVWYDKTRVIVPQKVKANEITSDYSWHNDKSKALLSWHRKQDFSIHYLELLSQRIWSGDLHWKKDTDKAIENTYQKMQTASISDLKHVYRFLQLLIEMQKNEYITEKKYHFNEVCSLALQLAKKHNQQEYINKFTQFKKVHEMNMEIDRLERVYKEKKESIDWLHTSKYKVISQISKDITNPYLMLSLAVRCDNTWLREKLLLRAVDSKQGHRLYGRLGNFYMYHHFYHEAIALHQCHLKFNPYELSSHYIIARAFGFVGEYKKALLHLEFLQQNFFDTSRELIFFEKARIFVLQKKYQKAKNALTKAREWVDKYGESINNFSSKFQIWQQVISNVKDKDFTLDLPDSEAIRWYYELGKIEKAYNVIDKAGDKTLILAIYRTILYNKISSFSAYDSIWKEAYDTAITTILYGKKRDYRAIAYRYALDFLELCPSTRYKQYANIHSDQLEFLKNLAKEWNGYYFVPLYMARFFYGKGHYARAVTLCHKAKQITPWYRREIERMEKIYLARWYYSGKPKSMNAKVRVNTARKIAWEIIDEESYGPAHNLLGRSYVKKNISLAKYHFEQVNPHQLAMSDLMDFYYHYSLLCAEQQQYDKAIVYMKKYLKLNPGHIWGDRTLKKFRQKASER
ncbi:serine/threonine-protein kinase [Candidatus Uabimicrobium amorphum]|uniref:Serine/threonine protein kinase n=1 Tax=Uabimicrobium amorphum TaxID=2596890 RepID=A0A5S9F1S8_UABAM|nr:serine/threonine-protein kinase [Candidatus Uabimicrobium amorphum]BBM82383.1 serine/threonine protein kinase [Candidatus Uabimicrobium amorphum]